LALEPNNIDAFALEPNNIDALIQNAHNYVKINSHRKAILLLRRVIELDPDQKKAWYNKAFSEDILDLRSMAVQSYMQYLRLATTKDMKQIEYAKKRIQILSR
jgi:hypothetical protein